MQNTLTEIKHSEFLQVLRSGKAISNVKINESFSLLDLIGPDETVSFPIHIENSVFCDFDIGFHTFEQPVLLKNCRFKSIFAMSCFFTRGFDLDSCIVEEDTDFTAGGHNKNRSLFSITNNKFVGFVSFYDTWFEEKVIVANNEFQGGTDLLADYSDIGGIAQFDKGLENRNNIGNLTMRDSK